MKKSLVIISLFLLTGCIENFKFGDSKTEENKTKKITETTTDEVSSIPEYTDSIEEVEYEGKQLEVKSYLDSYLGELQTLNTDGIIEMTYPKLFIPINKNIFRNYINTLLTSKHIHVQSFDTKIINIGDISAYSNGEFAQVEYYSIITLEFINPDLYKDELSIRVLNSVLTNKYGQENISINPEQRSITIKKLEKLLAIKDQEDGEWKFIGDNQEYRRLYPRILPLDILSQI